MIYGNKLSTKGIRAWMPACAGMTSMKTQAQRVIQASPTPITIFLIFVVPKEPHPYAFCHTMSAEVAEVEFTKYVVPRSRNIPRSSTTDAGKIDLKRAHSPLLFIAGEKDNIIPVSLVRKNFEAYTDKTSICDFEMFADRTHYICGQPGWESVAAFAKGWIANLR
jgi:pimeloyl-ACP methyl ester carboxylesterase